VGREEEEEEEKLQCDRCCRLLHCLRSPSSSSASPLPNFSLSAFCAQGGWRSCHGSAPTAKEEATSKRRNRAAPAEMSRRAPLLLIQGCLPSELDELLACSINLQTPRLNTLARSADRRNLAARCDPSSSPLHVKNCPSVLKTQTMVNTSMPKT